MSRFFYGAGAFYDGSPLLHPEKSLMMNRSFPTTISYGSRSNPLHASGRLRRRASLFLQSHAIYRVRQEIEAHEDFRVYHFSLPCLVHQPAMHQRKRNAVHGDVFMSHPAAFRYLVQPFRQVEGYHFRGQSGGGRPREQVRPGIRTVSRFFFQLTPSGLQCAFLPFISGDARRQSDGPGMQGNPVFLHQQQFAVLRHGHDHDGSIGIDPAHVFPPSFFQELQKFAPAEGITCFPGLFHLFHDAATLGFPTPLVNHPGCPLPEPLRGFLVWCL